MPTNPGDALLTRTRTPIKRRNAITELWNDGHSVPEIAHQIGVSTDRINNCLKAARLGYDTPEQECEARLAKQERAKK